MTAHSRRSRDLQGMQPGEPPKPFAAVIELSALNGTDGFRINGVAAGDHTGHSVASAGDINGDGFDDIVIGAPRAAQDDGGRVYVIYGKAGGFADLELSSLDGANGFSVLTGDRRTGFSVASAGDFNGDGFDDIVIGAPAGGFGINNQTFPGRSSVFLGGPASGYDQAGVTYRIIGRVNGDYSGRSVASAGDINGDGYDDLVIGAPYSSPNGRGSGASHVVFGQPGVYGATIDLYDLDGTNGFQIAGERGGDMFGWSVASAGDINGDGYGDLIVGARGGDPNGLGSGSSYVVFGKQTWLGANFELWLLDGANGFQIDGVGGSDESGFTVASAGDVNGDGYSDLVIGAPYADPNGVESSGAAYVVFGKASGFSATLNLSSLDGTNGFRLEGSGTYSRVGYAVASAGDINGDGYGDLIIGSDQHYGPPGSGSSYVVFGTASGHAPVMQLSSLDGTNGFRIARSDSDGGGGAVASAGDINNDGFDDLIVGHRYAGAYGYGSGASYVIFGRSTAAAVVTFTGGAGDDVSSGDAANDSLSGLGGKDTLNGLGGDDLLDGGDANDVLNGGDGADDLLGGLGGDTLNGDAGADELDGGDGADKLNGGIGGDTLGGGAGNDRMAGEADVDTLNGGAGNDYLDGGTGADIMSGGTENDVYIVDDAGDQTIELAGQGVDLVRSNIGWTLADHVEALELGGVANIDGTGNSGANNIQGNAGDNTLSGLAGVDTLNGGDGNDIIIGGETGDLLRGGSGADTFVVAHVNVGVLETDQVYDFNTADGDTIDLSGAFAGTIAKVDAFTRVAGQMTLSFAGGQTTLRLDLNGDGKADYQMKINGNVTEDWGGWSL